MAAEQLRRGLHERGVEVVGGAVGDHLGTAAGQLAGEDVVVGHHQDGGDPVAGEGGLDGVGGERGGEGTAYVVPEPAQTGLRHRGRLHRHHDAEGR
jgi:hypothetical protein